jgi:hypothetical protein
MKVMLLALVAGLGLFAVSAGIASANDPDDDHDWDHFGHHDDCDDWDHHDHDDDDHDMNGHSHDDDDDDKNHHGHDDDCDDNGHGHDDDECQEIVAAAIGAGGGAISWIGGGIAFGASGAAISGDPGNCLNHLFFVPAGHQFPWMTGAMYGGMHFPGYPAGYPMGVWTGY